MLRSSDVILLNEKLYSGFHEDIDQDEEITEKDMKDFFGIEDEEENDFEDKLTDDDKYFLKLMRDRQRG